MKQKLVFNLELFIEWLKKRGESDREIRLIIESQGWAKYEGMTLEEVNLEKTSVFEEWFELQEEE